MESRRDYLQLDALDPVTRAQTTVQISFDRMQTVARRSMGQASECGRTVPYILQNPTAVFEGLTDDRDEDRRGVGWRCYCGIPEQAFNTDGSTRRPYKDQVFLVFVNDEGVAYNWRWEHAALDDLELPINHSTRFKKRLS